MFYNVMTVFPTVYFCRISSNNLSKGLILPPRAWVEARLLLASVLDPSAIFFIFRTKKKRNKLTSVYQYPV